MGPWASHWLPLPLRRAWADPTWAGPVSVVAIAVEHTTSSAAGVEPRGRWASTIGELGAEAPISDGGRWCLGNERLRRWQRNPRSWPARLPRRQRLRGWAPKAGGRRRRCCCTRRGGRRRGNRRRRHHRRECVWRPEHGWGGARKGRAPAPGRRLAAAVLGSSPGRSGLGRISVVRVIVNSIADLMVNVLLMIHRKMRD
jgi:hypothetical protein